MILAEIARKALAGPKNRADYWFEKAGLIIQ
jgi:hypothetical protein